MLNQKDKNILLNIISTGDFTEISKMKTNLDNITRNNIIDKIKGNDIQCINYNKAQKLGDILSFENNNLKKNIVSLISFELNIYSNEYEKDKIYGKLNQLVSMLVSYPPKERIIKFLIKFLKASKAIREIVKTSKNIEMLKVIKNISGEIRHANIE